MKATIILLLILVSCQNVNNSKHKSESKDNSCTDSLKFIRLISATIDLPDLQEYYRDKDTLRKKELIILDNLLYFRGIEKLTKFNNPIRIMKGSEIRGKGIYIYIYYKKINIKNDTAFVYYRYGMKDLGIESTYFLKECKWQLINSRLFAN
jgi:hypothetical protein